MRSSGGIGCVVVVLCMVLLLLLPNDHASVQAAVTCGTVAKFITPCVPYATGRGPLSTACCNGVRNLNNAAKTTPDRQTTCKCLKSLAGSSSFPNAAGIPGKCGVSIPYPISTSTDCNKVT